MSFVPSKSWARTSTGSLPVKCGPFHWNVTCRFGDTPNTCQRIVPPATPVSRSSQKTAMVVSASVQLFENELGVGNPSLPLSMKVAVVYDVPKKSNAKGRFMVPVHSSAEQPRLPVVEMSSHGGSPVNVSRHAS